MSVGVIVISSDDEDDRDGGRNLDQRLDAIDLENDILDKSDPFNQGANDLQEPSFFDCKTYLLKHGMWASGSNEECVQRIKEHGRLKDGSGESLYPRSSFSINCTGDACRGDVVLFKQNMYGNQRNLIGRRIVAGRILEESYGASTQQHTFSVEVLWSEPSKKLKPLSVLQVKGRNFYQFGTFRQPWESEEDRIKVLREKHERGKAARLKRKLRETDFASGDNKGTKRHKVSHRGPYQSKCITRIDIQNDVNKNATAHNQAEWFQNMELERSIQLANHSDQNSFMYSDQHLQEEPLSFSRSLLPNDPLPSSFAGYSHNNNGQQGPNQTFSQPPDNHHHNHEPPVQRSTEENAKSRFPKSSFSINCTGDARNGDTVLFKQEVYLGGTKGQKKRTVAGRIVKVRQCESKEKHKFLIKVLWTTPSINDCRRSTLLVRSHILYKFGTFRQPWKNEANRSKMFEENLGPASCKRKSKKTDIASNKNEGAKRQKVSHNGTSQSKKQIEKAKQKASKEGASATSVKETKKGHKGKAVQLQKRKVKKSKQKDFHLDPNPNLNLSVSISSNLKSATSPNPNTLQNPNLKTRRKTKVKKSKQKTFDPDPIPNPNQNTNLNPSVSINSNLILATSPNPNTRQSPNMKTPQNPNANTQSNPRVKTHSNSNPNPHPNLDPHPNPNTHQYPNSNICPDHQQEPSLSLPYNRTFMPSCPPSRFSPNQPPFGLPGYGGQWGPNHVFIQPPAYYDYNQLIVLRLIVLLLVALLCLQQPQ